MTINPEIKGKLTEWCSNFVNSPVEPFDRETTQSILGISVNETKTPPKEVEELFIVKLITRRCMYMGMELTPGLTVLLALLSANSSIAVMYLSLLRFKQLESKAPNPLYTGDLLKIFPNGFPSEETLVKLWVEQKLEESGGNMLDIAFYKMGGTH